MCVIVCQGVVLHIGEACLRLGDRIQKYPYDTPQNVYNSQSFQYPNHRGKSDFLVIDNKQSHSEGRVLLATKSKTDLKVSYI